VTELVDYSKLITPFLRVKNLRPPEGLFLKAGNGILKRSVDRMSEEADNGGFMSHSTGLSPDNSLPSFQEYAPWQTHIMTLKRHG